MLFPREARAFPSPFSSPRSCCKMGATPPRPSRAQNTNIRPPPPPSLRRVSVAQLSKRRRNGTHVRMCMYIPFPGRPHTGRGLGRARPTSRWPSWAGLPRSPLLLPPPPRPRPRPPPSRRSRTRWGCPARGSSSRRAVGDICRRATGGGRTGGTEDTAGGEEGGGAFYFSTPATGRERAAELVLLPSGRGSGGRKAPENSQTEAGAERDVHLQR